MEIAAVIRVLAAATEAARMMGAILSSSILHIVSALFKMMPIRNGKGDGLLRYG